MSTPAPSNDPAAAVAIGANFAGSDSFFSGLQPPDSDGAIGPGYFVEFVNGAFAIYTTAGDLAQRSSLVDFFANAGLTTASAPFDPRILYDPQSARWFAAAIDGSDSFVLAVSDTSDPTQGWRAVSVPVAASAPKFLDFTALGVNEQGVYLEGSNDWYIVALPKADLLQPTPSVANAVAFSSVEDPVAANLPGFVAQPAVAPFLAGSEPFVSAANWAAGEVRVSSISWSGSVPQAPSVTGSLAVAPMDFPRSAPQLGTDVPIDTVDPRLTDSAVFQDGKLFAVQTVLGSDGRDVLRWYEIGNALTVPTLLASGDISPAGLDAYFGSIAVNPQGEVVIGFSASSPDQYVGSYAVAGTLTPDGIQFGAPMLLAAGSSDYVGGRWGDFSATTFDPADPSNFWTIQELPISSTAWQTQITELTFGAPSLVQSWSGGSGNFSDPGKWSPPGPPEMSATMLINTGRVHADGLVIGNPTIRLGSSSARPTLVLQDSTLAAANTIRVDDTASDGAKGVQARIKVLGAVTDDGAITVGALDSSPPPTAHLTINIARDSSLTLGPAGRWSVGGDSTIAVNAHGGAAQLVNDGEIDMSGGSVSIDAPVSGRGVFDVGVGDGATGTGVLEFGGSVARGETVRLTAGLLKLDQAMRFHGSIEDFTAASRIELSDTRADAVSFDTNRPGLLDVYAHHRIVAMLDIVGDFASDQFHITRDGANSFITLAQPTQVCAGWAPAAAPLANLAAPAESVLHQFG
jgi:hypothetical protein